MTSPAVMTKVERARANVIGVRQVAADIADRVLRATGISAQDVTAVNGQRAMDLVLSRPSELPNVVVGAALYEAMVLLGSYCNVALNAATEAVRLDSEPLATKAYSLSTTLQSTASFVQEKLVQAENAARALGLRGLERYSTISSGLASPGFGWVQAVAYAVVAGAVIYLIAVIAENIRSTGEEAADSARYMCEQRARATGRPCTREEFDRLYKDEAGRIQRDSLSNRLGEAVLAATKPVTDAAFWLLLIGGVGVALYFAAPYLSEKAAETTTRYSAARARARGGA